VKVKTYPMDFGSMVSGDNLMEMIENQSIAKYGSFQVLG
jgi:hypothetical protein